MGSQQIRVALVSPGAANETSFTHCQTTFLKVMRSAVTLDYVAEAAGECNGVQFTPISIFSPEHYDVVHFQWGNHPVHYFEFQKLLELSSRRKRPAIVSTLHEADLRFLIGASRQASSLRWKFRMRRLFETLDGQRASEYEFYSRQTVAEIMRRSDRVIVHSAYTKRRLIGEHSLNSMQAEKIVVANLCIDWNDYAGLADPLAAIRTSSKRRPMVFLYVGNLDKMKSLHKIVEALELVRHFGARNDCFLVVVGAGPEYYRIRRLADAALADQCVFAGSVPRISEYYALADVVVCPRALPRGEISGVIPEACAAGKPILLPDIGGWSEYVNETRGFLTRRDDTIEYAEAILHCLNHPEEVRQKGMKARQFAKEHLTWQSQVEFYESIYRHVC